MFEYLFEKFNKFYETIFHKYGIFLSKYYIFVIIASAALNIILTFGILKLNMIDDVDEVYGVINSEGKRHERYFKTIFNTTDTFENKYYMHQLIDFGTWVEINFRVRADKNANIIKREYFNEILAVHSQIINNVVYKKNENESFAFKDVCAHLHGDCVTDNLEMLKETFFDFLESQSVKKYEKIRDLKRKYARQNNITNVDTIELNSTYFKVEDPEHYTTVMFDFIPLKYFLGRHFYIIPNKSNKNKSIDYAYARLFKLRLSLNSNHDDGDPNVKAWELELLKYMANVKTELLTFTYAVSHSLDVEMDRNIRLDLKFVGFTFLLIMAFSILLMSINSNIITSPGFVLPFCGVLCAIFGITSAVGLLSYIGYPGCGFLVMLPFLVLGVGINDMFIIYSAFMHTDENRRTKERISAALHNSGVSVTITSITDFVAFLIGLTADFKSIQIFCVYAAVAIMFCYIYQLTFFSGWLVVHTKRVKANRNSLLWCIKHEEKNINKKNSNNFNHTTSNGIGNTNHYLNNDDDTISNEIQSKSRNTCMLVKFYKFISRTWRKMYKFLLRNNIGKCIVGIIFAIYITLSAWGASMIQEGISPTDLIADDSHFTDYIVSNTETVDLCPVIMIIFDKPLDYENQTTRKNIKSFLNQVQQLKGLRKDFILDWTVYFEPQLEKLSEGYNESIYNEIQSDNSPFSNDVVIRYNETLKRKQIVASRFYFQYEILHFTITDVNLMIDIRKLAASSELHPIAYSSYFKHIERMEYTTPNVIQSFVIGVEVMYIISLLFIPDLLAIICIILSMISIMVGLIACMHAWGLTLSPITMTLLILSVGFCIDFSAHLTHAFIASVGKGSRTRRAYYASMRIGMPIFNSAVSTILGICVLAFSRSYFFMSFFKTIFILMALGVLHSMLFLPVLLSLIGPHWSRHKDLPSQNNNHVSPENKKLVSNGNASHIADLKTNDEINQNEKADQ